MVLGLPFAHIPSRFAEDGHRGHDIEAIDPGQVRTAHAKQPGTQVEPRLIATLLLEPSLALLFRQMSPCAAGIRCRYQCRRHRNAPLPSGCLRSGFSASSPAVACGSSVANYPALRGRLLPWFSPVVWVSC